MDATGDGLLLGHRFTNRTTLFDSVEKFSRPNGATHPALNTQSMCRVSCVIGTKPSAILTTIANRLTDIDIGLKTTF